MTVAPGERVLLLPWVLGCVLWLVLPVFPVGLVRLCFHDTAQFSALPGSSLAHPAGAWAKLLCQGAAYAQDTEAGSLVATKSCSDPAPASQCF